MASLLENYSILILKLIGDQLEANIK